MSTNFPFNNRSHLKSPWPIPLLNRFHNSSKPTADPSMQTTNYRSLSFNVLVLPLNIQYRTLSFTYMTTTSMIPLLQHFHISIKYLIRSLSFTCAPTDPSPNIRLVFLEQFRSSPIHLNAKLQLHLHRTLTYPRTQSNPISRHKLKAKGKKTYLSLKNTSCSRRNAGFWFELRMKQWPKAREDGESKEGCNVWFEGMRSGWWK